MFSKIITLFCFATPNLHEEDIVSSKLIIIVTQTCVELKDDEWKFAWLGENIGKVVPPNTTHSWPILVKSSPVHVVVSIQAAVILLSKGVSPKILPLYSSN